MGQKQNFAKEDFQVRVAKLRDTLAKQFEEAKIFYMNDFDAGVISYHNGKNWTPIKLGTVLNRDINDLLRDIQSNLSNDPDLPENLLDPNYEANLCLDLIKYCRSNDIEYRYHEDKFLFEFQGFYFWHCLNITRNSEYREAEKYIRQKCQA